jgi:CDP-diacylglycerol--glycerol-3-phosphate 3-phosphatidyltransferase
MTPVPPLPSEMPDELPVVASVDDRFGPSAMVTPANAVTLIRLILSPALLVMILAEPSSWGAVSFWMALAVTDGVDGHLARRFGTTRSGAFLDPLADKVLVLGALFALVAAHRFWVLPVALIAVREVAVSLFRTHLGRQGLAVPARNLAKVKTIVQELAVGLALMPLTVEHPLLANCGLWLAVGLTLVTGAQYLLDGRSAGTTMVRAKA